MTLKGGILGVLRGLGCGSYLYVPPAAQRENPQVSAQNRGANLGHPPIEVLPYAEHELPEAQQEYLDREKANVEKSWIQTVLVSVDSVSALRRAFPNYYLDSTAFVKAMERAIGNGKQ